MEIGKEPIRLSSKDALLGKKMHCSLCKQPGHRCTKCPKKNANIQEEGREPVKTMDADMPEEREVEMVVNAAKDIPKKPEPSRRPNLPVRRKEKGIVIKEPSVNQSKHSLGKQGCASHTSKGKEKVVVQPKNKIRRPYLNLQGSQTSQTSKTPGASVSLRGGVLNLGQSISLNSKTR